MIKLFKKKNDLPKIHWQDITIARHRAILDVYAKYADDLNNLMFVYDLTAAAYGKDEDWINGMTINEASKWFQTLAFVNERPRTRPIKTHYVLNGHTYKTTLNPQNVSVSQYIDFQQLAPKASDMPGEFLSVILIPKGHKYNDGYEMTEVVSDIYNHMSVEDCLGLTAFFLHLLGMSMKRSLRVLTALEKKARKEGLMTEDQLEDLRKVRELLTSASGSRPSMP